MSDMNYSLCATYPLRYRPDKFMFFRLGDYSTYSQEYMPVARTEWAADIEPKIIGANPIDVKENLTEVRRWKYDENDDRSRTISFHDGTPFFELLFPKELKSIDCSNTKAIRNVLLSGFSLEENTSADLLIIIEETSSRYKAVYCARNKLKLTSSGRYCLSDNISDVLHATHHLPEYDIRKTDVISTESLGITSIDGTPAPIRYFYRFAVLPQSNARFHLFALDSYIPQFIGRYLRKNKELAGINNTDIRKITDIIQMILADHEYAAEYFATTGFSQAQLIERLPEYGASIIGDMLTDAEIDDAVRTTLLGSEKIKDHCLSVAQKEWEQEQNAVKAAILEEIAILSDSQSDLERQIDCASKRLTIQANRSTEFDANIADKEAALAKLQVDIDNELQQFSENIAHNIAITTAIKTISAPGQGTSSGSSISVKTNSFASTGVDEEITDRADFEEYLSENLEVLGYSSADAVDLSQLISFCVYNKLPLVVANDGEKIANAVSALFGMDQTRLLNIPSGIADVYSIPKQIELTLNASSAVVMYITGVFDGYSLGVFNILRHYIKESLNPVFFILSLDGIDTNMLPRTVWEHAMYLDDDSILQYEEDAPLSMYEGVSNLETQYKGNEVRSKLKALKPFMDIVDSRSCIQLAKYMVDSATDISDSGTVLQQLFVLADARGNVDTLTEILKDYSISDKAGRLVKKYM